MEVNNLLEKLYNFLDKHSDFNAVEHPLFQFSFKFDNNYIAQKIFNTNVTAIHVPIESEMEIDLEENLYDDTIFSEVLDDLLKNGTTFEIRIAFYKNNVFNHYEIYKGCQIKQYNRSVLDLKKQTSTFYLFVEWENKEIEKSFI